jgi:ketosteroid isomerase-like protein
MNETDEFLTAVHPQLTAADTAIHDGDPSQRIALWSHHEPVTLFGAAVTKTGWDDLRSTFEWLGSRFSDCSAFEYKVIAAGASGDLAYIAGIEHTTASINGAEPEPYALRVTTIFRREDGNWKVVHRHGDPYDDSGGDVANRLAQSR